MKKTLCIMSAFMLMALVSPNLRAACETSIVPVTTSTTTNAEEQSAILARVYEIKRMDKSNLSLSEKKELRTELKSLKKRYRDGGGVYLSVGALIIIILLLILFLR
jgi:hypothetical protein